LAIVAIKTPAATATFSDSTRPLPEGLPDMHRKPSEYILIHMKQILIELDDRCARDLERVAPARNRKRAEFVRLAIRSAIDRALDRATGDAYRSRPLPGDVLASDLVGWDEQNGLARPSERTRGRRRSAKSAA
jgi:hypothetical protein